MSGESYRPEASGKPPVSTRAIARQGTSSVAFRGEEPDPDDPLLSFEPVPHVAPRRNSITAERQRAFIAHLAATGIVKQAARHIGASLEALYKLRHKHGGEAFSAAWDLALDRGVARLEDCALARAIEGEERMVVSAGKVLGTEVRHNEALIMFFLRNRRGERYAPDWRALKPGHPLYERIAAEAVARYRAEEEESEEEVRQSIDRFLEGMRERRLANERILAEDLPQKENEVEPGEDGPGTRPRPSSVAVLQRRAAMTDRKQDRGTPHDERQQNQEGQNQSAGRPGEGGQPGQAGDLAGMEGQETVRGGQQGQPAKRGDSKGEHGGNR